MKSAEKKYNARDAILNYLLKNGLDETGIRTLASAAGTSDRMLIYYFGNKESLITDVLYDLANKVIKEIVEEIGSHKRDAKTLIADLDKALARPDFSDVMKLLLEAIARAARNIEPFRATVVSVYSRWHDLVDQRLLDPANTTHVMVQVEGKNMMRIIKGFSPEPE